MDQDGEIQSAVLYEQSPQVECFVQYLTYYKNLSSCTKSFEDSDFIDEVSYAFLAVAILYWYNVFAYEKSHLHWIKIIKNMPENIKQNFLNQVYKATNLNKEEYTNYLEKLMCLRDKYIAHRDRNWQEHIRNCPGFETALKVAKVHECWVNELLQGENPTFSIDSLSVIMKSAEVEIKHVIALLSSQKR